MKFMFCPDREVTTLYRLGHWYDRVITKRGRETLWLRRVSDN